MQGTTVQWWFRNQKTSFARTADPRQTSCSLIFLRCAVLVIIVFAGTVTGQSFKHLAGNVAQNFLDHFGDCRLPAWPVLPARSASDRLWFIFLQEKPPGGGFGLQYARLLVG
jgi:hypothetical protein